MPIVLNVMLFSTLDDESSVDYISNKNPPKSKKYSRIRKEVDVKNIINWRTRIEKNQINMLRSPSESLS